MKPQTYMNLSGDAVRDVLRYHGQELGGDLANELLVVQDDLDLAEGRLRLRAKGSAGGHRGVQSIIAQVGHGNFARVKIGIGRSDEKEATEYVLETAAPDSRRALEQATERAVEALTAWIDDGILTSMNRFNVRPAADPAPGEDRPERAQAAGGDPARGSDSEPEPGVERPND